LLLNVRLFSKPYGSVKFLQVDFDRVAFGRFVRRIRFARAIRFTFRGVLVGSVVGAVWAILDLAGLLLANWWQVGGIVFISAVIGGVYGWLLAVPVDLVAKSVDHRVGLSDRLVTALEPGSSEFHDEVRQDAVARLSGVSAKEVYPVTLGKAQAAMLFSVAIPLAILFVSYNHLLLKPEERMQRFAEKKAADEIEHVLKPVVQDPKPSADQVALTAKLERFQRELERGKLNKDEAKERADKISQQAERLMHEENRQTTQSLDSAQDALSRMKREESLSKATPPDPQTGLTGEESEKELRELAAKAPTKSQMEQLQKRISELEKRLSSAKTDQEKKAMKTELSKMQQSMKQMKLTQAAQEMLRRLQSNPEFKKLQEMIDQLQKNAKGMDQGEQKQLADEQIKQMEQALEKMAKELKSDEDMKKMIQSMEKALQESKSAGNMQAMSDALAQISAMSQGGAPNTNPGPPNGAHLNMIDKEAKGQGKTNVVGAEADHRPDEGPAPYLEQRGMAKLSGPSSIPMMADVRASERKAEEAIDHQRIPKEHQERVKRYFEALEGRR
jgi:hypothetical protein